MRDEYGTSGKEFDTLEEMGALPQELLAVSDEVNKPAKEHLIPEEFPSNVSISDKELKKKAQQKNHKKLLRKMVYALSSMAMIVTLAQVSEMDNIQITTQREEESNTAFEWPKVPGLDVEENDIIADNFEESEGESGETISTQVITIEGEGITEHKIYGVGDVGVYQSYNSYLESMYEYPTFIGGDVVYNGDGTKTINAYFCIDTFYTYEEEGGYAWPGWSFRLTDRYHYELVSGDDDNIYHLTQEDGTQIEAVLDSFEYYSPNDAFRDVEGVYAITVPEDYDDLVFVLLGQDIQSNFSEELPFFFVIEEDALTDARNWTEAKGIQLSDYYGVFEDEGGNQQEVKWIFSQSNDGEEIKVYVDSDNNEYGEEYVIPTEGKTRIHGYLPVSATVWLHYFDLLDYETGMSIIKPGEVFARTDADGGTDIWIPKEEYSDFAFVSRNFVGDSWYVDVVIPSDYDGRLVLHVAAGGEEYYTLLP